MWGLVMSARDIARFGLLVQRHGRWAGEEIIAGTDDGGDSEYLSAALRSSSPANPGYGYLWWLNGQTGYRVGPAGALQPGPLVPSAPSDLVAALGKDDQKIYVSRSAGLVVARRVDGPDPAAGSRCPTSTPSCGG